MRKTQVMSRKVFAGVDIGGTKTAVCLSAAPPELLVRKEFPTNPARGSKQTIKKIISTLHELLAQNHLDATALHSIGVSCGGPLDPVAGTIESPPNLKTWKHVRIKEILETEFHVRCLLENDANAGALAEHRFGAGRGASNIVFLTLGTGLGAGLILNGQLYRGSTSNAGELGHIRLSRTGAIGYDKTGSAEGWASGGGMGRTAVIAVKRSLARGLPTLLPMDTENITARQVWEAAKKGDRVAAEVVQSCGEKLGEAIAIVMDLLNPERVVVGGIALRMGETLLGPARAAIQREALPATAQHCEILVAKLGEGIGDVAALCVAMQDASTGQRMMKVDKSAC